MTTIIESSNYINDNVKHYSSSKKLKSRKANRHKYRKIKEVKKVLKEYHRIHSNSADSNEYDNYNVSYLDKFSTYFHKIKIEQRETSKGRKSIKQMKQKAKHSKPYHLKSNHDKSQRTKSIKKILAKAGYNKYDINDLTALNSNNKLLRKSRSDKIYHYDDINQDLGHFHGNSMNPKVSIIPTGTYCTPYATFYEYQRSVIAQQCNFFGCILIQHEELEWTPNKKAVTRWKLLLLFDNTYHCWLEVDYYNIANHPQWFNNWLMLEQGRIKERYRDECITENHIKPYSWNIQPFICNICTKYCCNLCIHKGQCKSCVIEAEKERLTTVIAGLLDYDGGIVKTLMEFSTGKILNCQGVGCDRGLNTNNIFDYYKIHEKYVYRRLICPECRKRKPKRIPERIPVHVPFRIMNPLMVKYSYLDIKKEDQYENQMENWSLSKNKRCCRDGWSAGEINENYVFRYSCHGWIAFMIRLSQDGVRVPTDVRPRSHGTPTERKIRNALFITDFDIIGVDTHWDLTQLLLNYGDLKKQVFIGMDCYKRPFAIAQFVDDEAAELCKLDGLYDRNKKMHIEWVDRNVDGCQYEEDEVVREDLNKNEIDGKIMDVCFEDGSVKMYNKSKQERKKKKKLVMRNKREDRKRKFGKAYGDQRWNDKKMNKKANKRFVMRCCKIEIENIKNKNFDYGFVH